MCVFLKKGHTQSGSIMSRRSHHMIFFAYHILCIFFFYSLMNTAEY